MQFNRSVRRGFCASLLLGVLTSGLANAATSSVPTVDLSKFKAITTTIGGATVLPTTRTVAHWWGSGGDPHNGVTYGYNMVGADPNNCPDTGCSVTIEVDITPIIVNIGGQTFSGTDVVGPTLSSPQFALNDYGSTPAATVNAANLPSGAGGVLSQGDAGLPLQLEDSIMRAQFNKTGPSSYHLILHPNILPAVTIKVPPGQGAVYETGHGVMFANVNMTWWAAYIQQLETHANPTHLPFYLTNNVLAGNITKGACCVLGFHGANVLVGNSSGSTASRGNAPVQTFAWASWLQPGLFRPWALQDIHALSHEISEWSDDPFVTNNVEPWLTPTAPQYGCTGLLETGDPVVAIGFAKGMNTFQQGYNPDGTQSADGYYHPEDEALLPWFLRTAPNDVSEPTQSSSTNTGRYTFMGELNPFPGFRQPASGCSGS